MRCCRLQVSHLHTQPLLETSIQNLTSILSMNLMIQPNQICLIVKLYNNRPELLPDNNELHCIILKLMCTFVLLSADNVHMKAFSFLFLERIWTIRVLIKHTRITGIKVIAYAGYSYGFPIAIAESVSRKSYPLYGCPEPAQIRF